MCMMIGCVQMFRGMVLNELNRCSSCNSSGDDHFCILSTLVLLDCPLKTESYHENIRIDINTAELET